MILKLGSQGDAVFHLQNGLTLLGFPCGPKGLDGDFGKKTEDAVEAFQRAHDLYADGVAGPITLQEYNTAVASVPNGAQWVVALDPPGEDPKVKNQDREWITVATDKIPGSGGYKMMTIRDDVATIFEKLYADVHTLGGVITSAGGKRPLNAKLNSGRSATSMHYVGRAFDMATDTGLRNPIKDRYILELAQDGRHWIVWCRSSLSPENLETLAKNLGTEGGSRILKACVATKAKPIFASVTATVFNMTKLWNKYGFEGISAQKSFLSGKGGSAEWWHASYLVGLIKGKTTFGQELLRLYTLQQVRDSFPGWERAKDCVFGVTWF